MLPSDIPGAEEEEGGTLPPPSRFLLASPYFYLFIYFLLHLNLSLFLIYLSPPFVLSFSLSTSLRRNCFIFIHLN